MYLHLGQYTVVRTSDIIGIFDLDNTTVSKKTRDFLAAAERDKKVVNVSEELPKSFIICKNGEEKLYISLLSPNTLIKRLS